MIWIVVLLVGLLAFSNGCNDNGKGVATLVGFGAATPSQALIYASIATALGGIVSFFVAGGLLQGFSGSWLFANAPRLDQTFYIATLIGACSWMLLANKTGMPVSTTHAIIGALCGGGMVEFGMGRMHWAMLGQSFAAPLAVSPLLSLAVVYLLAWPLGYLTVKFAARCLCVIEQPCAGAAPVASGAATAIAAGDSRLAIIRGQVSECAQALPVATVTTSAAANALHWISAGLISFARGWNDTPKIAALCLIALAAVSHGALIGFSVVTVAMAAGGLLRGRKVLDTLAKKLTPLPLSESLTASLVTAALVGLASWNSLPVSTTQVATGAIIGAGLKNNPKSVKWAKLGEIVLSWIITLPVAGVIAALAMLVLRRV